MVNKPLIRPAISGGGTLGAGWLTSHDDFCLLLLDDVSLFSGLKRLDDT